MITRSTLGKVVLRLGAHRRLGAYGAIALACLLVLAAVSTTLHAVGLQPICPTLSEGSSWAIDMCDTDPNIATPMTVAVDGVLRGHAALVRIYHKSQTGPDVPQRPKARSIKLYRL